MTLSQKSRQASWRRSAFGALAALVGELLLEFEGRDGPEVERWREPGRLVEPGEVADVGVGAGPLHRAGHQLAAVSLTGPGGVGDPFRRGVDAEVVLGRGPADGDVGRCAQLPRPWRRLAARRPQPRPRERREDAERAPLAGDDRGRLGAGDAGVADELRPGLLERGCDPAVAAAGVGGVVAIDVNLPGAALGGQRGQLLRRVAVAEVQRRPRGAQALTELAQRGQQVGVAVRGSVAATGQPVLEAEDGDDVVGGRRRGERGVVGEPQVASEPDDAYGHGRAYSRLAGRSSMASRHRRSACSV